MKRILLLLIVAVTGAAAATARDFTYTYEGQTLTYTVLDEDAKTCEVSSNNKISGSLIIPESVSDGSNEYSVTSIGERAFQGGSGLTSVTIPNSVTSIGRLAFCQCRNLSSATISESITVLNYGVFSHTALTSVIIPERVTCIGGEAFDFCTNLTSVTIPNSVIIIDEGAFWGCSELKSLNIPNSVTSIGRFAFRDCSGLTSVTIGNSVTSMGTAAFYGCSSLTLVKVLASEPTEFSGFSIDVFANAVLDIPAGSLKKYAVSDWGTFDNIREDGVMSKTYNDGVFKYRLIPDAVNPEAVLMKGDYSAMEEISIPERFTDESDPTNPVRYTIATIGANAFYECSNLKSVNFHARTKITAIAPRAFSDCSGLTEISIPESVTTISSEAFSNCSSLTKAEFASIESLCNIDFANGSANPLCRAHNLYINGEEITKLVIPESVSAIGQYAFNCCSGLTSVTIPNTVTSIGYAAFDDCTGLTSVTIPNSVSSIGGYAFSSCRGLTSVKIPNSVSEIGIWAFTNCSGLTSVTLGNSLSELDSSVFNGCNAISSLTLADGGNYLELQGEGETAWLNNVSRLYLGRNIMTPEGTFVKFPALTDLEIGEGLNEITPSAFAGYSDLSSLKLSNAVAKIGSNAFAGCSSLTSVVIPNSVTSLGNRAFSGCSAITDLTIGNSVPSVSSTVFEGCPAIKTLTVADGPGTLSFQTGNSWLNNVTKLYMGRNMAYTSGGDLKFPAVNDLTVGNEVTEIGASMFANCTGIKELPLGNNLLTIGSSAFSGCSLTELVVPPSVETIEASAFAGNTDLATIIMGHNVKTIGERAYDGCAAQTIRITALTPPTAPNNTFSRYTGQLWVANAQAVEDYYNAYTCWDRFSAYSMIEPEAITIEGEKTIDAAPGSVIRLTATIAPENVTLPQIFWRSTDPAIATVDNDGVVTVHGEQPEYAAYTTYAYDGDAITPGQCRIIAESLYANGPLAEVVINSDISAIDEISTDPSAEKATVDYSQPYDVYNMQGIRVGDSTAGLLPGLYIIRQGAATAKIAIR